MFLSNTGCGHCHWCMMRKKLIGKSISSDARIAAEWKKAAYREVMLAMHPFG